MKSFKTYLVSLTLSSLAAISFAPSADAMDLVREETRVDDAAAKYGVTGSNILVAIFDRGLDWQHTDFRNPDGTTRIEFIFDLTDDSGATDPDNPYGMGTIYTKAQIDDALRNGTDLSTRDAVGHGTTTAGIICGGGQIIPLYSGIAPRARIIVVKITSDGAPAHDGEPEEISFNHPERTPVAINFTTNKAAVLGLPCVMLLNVGSVGGPTDGTSSQCRKVDDTVGAGKPGLAFVTGTCDDGGASNRAGGVVTAGQTANLQIEKVGADSVVCDLWYSEADRFDVAIVTPNGAFGPYTAPATDTNFDSKTTSDFFYYHLGAGVESWGAASSKREIYVRLDGPAGAYQIQLTGATVTSGRFDATLNPSRLDPYNAPVNRFLNFVAPGSIWDLATASNNICPNSYVIRTNYTDIDHVPRTVPNEGALGGLWNSSGVGPTFDGRLGVDISAPGNSLFTTYNPRSYWATFRSNLIEGGNTNYGRAGAVSAASPIVTGIIALMLEMNPTLDAARIKHILQATARADAFTGATPNATWGYGKVDALAALDLVYAAVSLSMPSTPSGVSASDGTYTDRVAVTWSAVTNATGYQVWRNTETNSASAIQVATNLFGVVYDDTSVTAGTTYYYWITAKNYYGTSGFSEADAGWASCSSESRVPVYRLYSYGAAESTYEHLWTTSEAEKDVLDSWPSWQYEGIAWYAYTNQVSGTVPLYRLYAASVKQHHYTIDEGEYSILNGNGTWSGEGVQYYVGASAAGRAVPAYRFYHEGLALHHFTIDENERDSIVANPDWGYAYEGVGYYVYEH